MPRSVIKRKVNKASKAQRKRWTRTRIVRAIENSSDYVPEDLHVEYFKNLPDENLPELDIQVEDPVTLPKLNGNRIVDISFIFTQMDVLQTHNQQCQVWSQASSEIIKNGFKKAVISEQNYDAASLQRWRSHKPNPTQEETVQVSSEQHGYERQPPQDDLDQIPPSHKKAPMQVTSTAPDLQPSTSELIPESNVSFEAILLKTVNKRNSENLIRKPKRKVCNGAEVVTSKDVLQRLEQLDKMKNKSKPKKPPVVEEITSDEEDENEVLTESEEEVNMNFVEEFEEMEQDLENVTKQVNDIEIDDWVLVKFPGKKSVKHYVGQIISISEDCITVKFARKSSFLKKKSVFSFPSVEDCSIVFDFDIVSVLPVPSIGQRGEITFEISFDSYNI
ncbi:hypothetical protein RN001_013276 [Aquatica leii]|uniref:Uncharacterized protein n=1 Tax=Aquatica leii TaxID=1421715 RepID=A0AAN7S6X5_9COLE|nr:hypothetical protein RN001_013276 [Aquatica leii]